MERKAQSLAPVCYQGKPIELDARDNVKITKCQRGFFRNSLFIVGIFNDFTVKGLGSKVIFVKFLKREVEDFELNK